MLDITSVMEDYVIEGACALDELDLDEALEGIGDKFKGAGSAIKGGAGKAALMASKGGAQLKTAAVRLLNAIRALLLKINEHMNKARGAISKFNVNKAKYDAAKAVLDACTKSHASIQDPLDAYQYLTSDAVTAKADALSNASGDATTMVSSGDLTKMMETGQRILKVCQRSIKGAPDRDTLKAINKTVSLVSRAMNVVFGMNMKGSHGIRKEKAASDRKIAKKDREIKKNEKDSKREMERKLKEQSKKKDNKK